jgi:CheY-like chemotaxis protein
VAHNRATPTARTPHHETGAGGIASVEVTTARSVADAVAAVEAAPVDVLVSDIELPDGSGCVSTV